MRPDYLVVGAGLTGCVIARTLIDAGRDVVIVERRECLGGNIRDFVHPTGIRIHAHGPHYFRTSSESIWNFVNRFSTFDHFECEVRTLVNGELEQWPVTKEYMDRVVGKNWAPEFTGIARNFEEACLKMMPRTVYEQFVRDYTEKQWGVSPKCLAPGLAARFAVRSNNDRRLKTDRYQGLPRHGYSAFVSQLVDGIPTRLSYDYLKRKAELRPKRLTIYTGPLDEFCDFEYGKLHYRSQRREHSVHRVAGLKLPCVQVNTPSHCAGSSIRTIEWKHMMPEDCRSKIDSTVLTTETPYSPISPDEYEYPFPDDDNHALRAKYQKRLASISNVLVCGRLGEYRYYDMDQAIARALLLAQRILRKPR